MIRQFLKKTCVPRIQKGKIKIVAKMYKNRRYVDFKRPVTLFINLKRIAELSSLVSPNTIPELLSWKVTLNVYS